MAPRENTTRPSQGRKSVQASDQNFQSSSGNGTSKSTNKTNRSQASTRTAKDKDWAQTLQDGYREGNKWFRFFKNKEDLRRFGKTKDCLAKKSEDLLKQLRRRRREHKDPRYQLHTLETKLGRLKRKPEANIFHELEDLVCPAAEGLADIHVDDPELEERYLDLAEGWGEQWDKRIPMLDRPPPSPDYFVGFSRNAFLPDQRDELDRNANATTTFKATSLVCLPFLTCEAKALDVFEVAESQNCWSMFIAVRATVKLFEIANLQDDINREILAFSVGYNQRDVEVHAYYPILDKDCTKIFRREILSNSLMPSRNSNDPWKALDLVRNVYEIWAPEHLDRVRKAIDAISQRTISSSTKVGSAAEAPSELASSASDSHSSSTEVPSDARSRPRSSSAASGASKKRRLEDQPAGSTGMSFDAGALSLEESLEESIE
ncbi:uncharacterized protein LTHEOB_4257 [Lasiodiplodia theobromae]|uniref:uncharacterized protein n=1 Tax=Lasiodiplodia theobromae TaxID=45133 RepID=UPI0015C3723B|nr:uncharacterized protein LTHEOB_4257 [Lasiodiplodia theobromae]KAF4546260.1 hypothetical protein LTHEOB_4257 [Lasiodiplodia theobromae]